MILFWIPSLQINVIVINFNIFLLFVSFSFLNVACIIFLWGSAALEHNKA